MMIVFERALWSESTKSRPLKGWFTIQNSEMRGGDLLSLSNGIFYSEFQARTRNVVSTSRFTAF